MTFNFHGNYTKLFVSVLCLFVKMLILLRTYFVFVFEINCLKLLN